ncbi:hypothetical protein [Mycobacteroides abscessus]|uniref:hypothetical protein n=1 Tax=Mycobacteroides abscessus TaxID=36809 RepID=UPI001056B5C1|nr:hypothetical protein [Mycobacteroides abscessus]
MATTYHPVQPPTSGFSTPGGVLPYPEPTGGKPPRRTGLLVAIAAVAVGAGLIGAAIGAAVGVGIASHNEAAPVSKVPTAAEVKAANVDLCTRFAAAYAAMPSHQSSGMDVLPVATELRDAVTDNPHADAKLLNAVSVVADLTRQQAAVLSREQSKGYVQPPGDWSADKANEASVKAWNLCQGIS